jgi:hypothetical protein
LREIQALTAKIANARPRLPMFMIRCIMHTKGEVRMARNSAIKHKHYALDETKIKHAKKLLGTKTETETIERALEEVISERERERRAWEVTERFIRSGAVIKDVFGKLGEAED